MKPIQIYIGWDARETVAYHVLSHSLIRHSSVPLAITPLKQQALRDLGIYTRPRGKFETTEFSLTRFLVPYLSGYEGFSIFMDCDMLCKANIADLWQHYDPKQAVWVCQHDYTPKTMLKMDHQPQTTYPRKNWSSFMIFNNAECRALTPDYVNNATGLELHRFSWLSDERIGALPLEWNWLVSEYPHNDDAKLLHYTNGGPWFWQTRNCDHAHDWHQELNLAFPSLSLPKEEHAAVSVEV